MKCKSILIVEDDCDIREAFEDFLTSEGFDVYTAMNGKEGLELLKRIPGPALIFLDLMMPVMNGWEFLEAQKGDHVIASLPVVVVSALRSDSVLGKEQRPAQTAGYLKKPISIDSITKIVSQYFD